MPFTAFEFIGARRRVRTWVSVLWGAAWLAAAPAALAGDLAVTPLFDGERTGLLGSSEFFNNWGGGFGLGNTSGVVRDTTVAHSGAASIRADLGTVTTSGKFFQTFASELTANPVYRQTRDLTRYESFQFFVRNGTGAPLNLTFEIKDFRDDNNHRARRTFSIPAGTAWTPLTATLDLEDPAWNVTGSPDISRTYATAFTVATQSGTAAGTLHIDDFTLHEAGGPIDVATADITTIAERLAERQFSGLWTARNRTTGLIYNTSHDVHVAAMNTTGGVLWMLPAAVRRGWVSQADADAWAGQIAASLNTNLDETSGAQPRYVPTRFIDPGTAARPGGANEESVIDASFIKLALHHYQHQPTTPPALAAQLQSVAERFRLDAFANGNGFRLAFFPASGFTSGWYDGYTNEGKTISLAAELSQAHHVPLEQYWNADDHRSRVFLVNPDDAHLTHSLTQFRAPFEQALLNLFVDTSQRGVDNYPVRALATNPWENYVRYERETAARLDELGRTNFFQPDAAFGAQGVYEQFSLYNNFGNPSLFMPWSASLALLAGAPNAEQALRFLLDNGMHGPLGLADSARWTVGASSPTNVRAVQDNWNVVLSTMALLEFLDRQRGSQSASQFFAALPQVAAALDEVFVDGDLNGDGQTTAADLAVWRAGFGDAAGATPAGGDADGDGRVDGFDFLRWQRGFGSAPTAGSVPEATTLTLLLGVPLAWRSLGRRLLQRKNRP